MVGGDDPKPTGTGTHPQVRFVIVPDKLRPFTPVSPTVHAVEDDPGPHGRKTLTQVRVWHGRTFGIGPHVVTDKPADGDPRSPGKGTQRRSGIVINFSLRGRIKAAASEHLTVEPEVRTVRPVETELVVTLPVGFHEARAEGKPYALLACNQRHLPEPVSHSMGVKIVRVAAQ